jgi:hypothetical protein
VEAAASGSSLGSSLWIVLVPLALSLIVAGLSVGGWWYLRQRGHAAPAAATTPAVLSFACPGCGKRLKAKPEHAGNKLKCPHCAKAVAVPKAASNGAGGAA